MAVKLTPKQQRWCEEYLTDLCASKAAARAGYSEKTARQIGAENLSKPYLMAVVADLKAKRAEKVKINSDDVLEILRTQVLADPRELYEKDGTTLRNVHSWPLGWRLLLNDLSVSADGTVRAKFSDRTRLISLLGKHTDVGAYTKKIEVEAGESLVDYLREAGERVRNRARTDATGKLISSDDETDSSQ